MALLLAPSSSFAPRANPVFRSYFAPHNLSPEHVAATDPPILVTLLPPVAHGGPDQLSAVLDNHLVGGDVHLCEESPAVDVAPQRLQPHLERHGLELGVLPRELLRRAKRAAKE